MSDSVPQFALITGPINTKLTLDDGTEVDVAPAVVVLDSQEKVDELAHKIGQYWADPATPMHPSHTLEVPFEYNTPEEAHKALVESPTHPLED